MIQAWCTGTMESYVVRIYENGGRKSVYDYNPHSLDALYKALCGVMGQADIATKMTIDGELVITVAAAPVVAGSLVRVTPAKTPNHAWAEYVQLHFGAVKT